VQASIRLLIIEDSADDAELVQRLLRQGGYEIAAERVDSALGLTQALEEKWDVVISDYSMPQFSGSEALRIVRKRTPETPFIFVSGTIGEDTATEAMRVGAQDYVLKTNLRRLVPAVKREIREAKNRRRLKERVQSDQIILNSIADAVLSTDLSGNITYLNSVKEARHRQLAETSPDAILVHRDGRIVYANRAAAHLVKLKNPQTMIDRRLEGFVSPECQRDLLAHRAGVFAASLRRSDGASVYAEIAASPISMNGHGSTLLVCRDVTERVTLEHELLDVATREQARLAHDLHDGLGQQLTGISLYLRGLGSQIGREMPAHAADFARLDALVAKAIEDTRRLARGMSPLAVGREGLASALIALSAQARELYGLQVVLDIDSLIDASIEAQVASQLYRIVQEATSNAARHARAKSIEIAVQLADSRLTLVIADDGIGMAESPPSSGRAAGLGLRIMRYRAERIRGTFQIERRSPGTAIRVSLPLNERRPPAP
jgi:two-component system sensor histidine kinase UhpB